MEIDDTRQQIIDQKGHILVKGGPGSGKTTIALEKVRRSFETLKNNQKILFLSFSKAAIKQIADRAAQVLESENKSLLVMQTYHSFCWEILKSHFYLLSKSRNIQIVPPHSEAILKNTYKGNDWEQHLEDQFIDNGQTTYNHFAPKTLELFTRSKSLLQIYSRTFPLIIVDEFQDSDQDQWGIVRLLSENSQILCLADPDQRIFDWRPSVNLKRIEEVENLLKPASFNFENQNFRSPNSGVLQFANSLLLNDTPIDYPNDGSLKKINYQFGQLPSYVKISLYKLIEKVSLEKEDWSIAILTKTNKMVRSVSNGLDEEQVFLRRKLPPFSHSVVIDEQAVVLAGRIIAYLLQPRKTEEKEDLASLILLLMDISNAKKITNTSVAMAAKLDKARKELLEGKAIKIKLVKELKRIRDIVLQSGYYSGEPFNDWLKVRAELENSEDIEISRLSKTARQMRYLRRGTQITDTLTNDWRQNKCYLNALKDFDGAVFQAQISESHIPFTGVVVMNMHKSKGKEFDGVIVIDGQYGDALIAFDKPPYSKSKRLVRVALTRAKKAAYVLTSNNEPCPLFP
ncbi:MAG: ATP-dependent helicase [Cyclobacteriaceae bacterium]